MKRRLHAGRQGFAFGEFLGAARFTRLKGKQLSWGKSHDNKRVPTGGPLSWEGEQVPLRAPGVTHPSVRMEDSGYKENPANCNLLRDMGPTCLTFSAL